MDTLTRIAIFHSYFEAFPSEDQLLKYSLFENKIPSFMSRPLLQMAALLREVKRKSRNLFPTVKLWGKKT